MEWHEQDGEEWYLGGSLDPVWPVTQQWGGIESTDMPVHSTLMDALQSDEAKAIREGMKQLKGK